MPLAWEPTMTTGVRSVDDQHKELFRQVAALKDAMSQGKGRDEIARVLGFLGDYVVKHFSEEERVMARYACPAAAANKAAHAAFLAKFKELRARFDTAGAGPALVLETFDVVTKWLVEHIHKIDTQLLASVAGQEKTLVGTGTAG
ncbi:MAG: bacteriohemerythrin [Pirellulales bacterium]